MNAGSNVSAIPVTPSLAAATCFPCQIGMSGVSWAAIVWICSNA